ncbi:hypothetical protein B0H14DRAFT_2688898 [Mycena olivaceomarginata]|nr:hypothetical protein B0H14DRAFT_2688898 [Mycena olivaceomarginata]
MGMRDVGVESDANDEVDSMLSILSQTSGLVQFRGQNSFNSNQFVWDEALISWNAFKAMAQCSGANLRHCSAEVGPCEDASAAVFDHLTALHTLIWHCRAAFTDMHTVDGLPNLEKLGILLTSQSFYTVLCLMKLKSLRHVVLSDYAPSPETFLEAHGPKLTRLELPHSTAQALGVKMFDLCPNLRAILLSVNGHPPGPRLAASLERIILETPYQYRSRQLHKDQIPGWEQFFIGIEPEIFPALREIHVKICVWPTNERDIAKSCWVRWAEILHEGNINLTDKDVMKWRPRLKVK